MLGERSGEGGATGADGDEGNSGGGGGGQQKVVGNGWSGVFGFMGPLRPERCAGVGIAGGGVGADGGSTSTALRAISMSPKQFVNRILAD